MTFYLMPKHVNPENITQANLDKAVKLGPAREVNIIPDLGKFRTAVTQSTLKTATLRFKFTGPTNKRFFKALGIYRLPGDKPLIHNGKKPR